MSSNYGKLKVGTLMECTHSKSIAYNKGQTYKVVENESGQSKAKGLVGNDGLFDPFSLICSSFKVADVNKQAIEHLKRGNEMKNYVSKYSDAAKETH